MTPPETEKGFGTGLRSHIERTQAAEALVTVTEDELAAAEVEVESTEAAELASVAVLELPADVEAEPSAPDPELTAELEQARDEARAALERERVARDELQQSSQAVAEREQELKTWAQDLDEREQSLRQRITELEREQAALVERHTEIVAEYARVQELAGHAEGRVDELEHAERDRAEAAAELAKQLAEVGERERELKRERAAFDAARA